jgi:hypothetical protein
MTSIRTGNSVVVLFLFGCPIGKYFNLALQRDPLASNGSRRVCFLPVLDWLLNEAPAGVDARRRAEKTGLPLAAKKLTVGCGETLYVPLVNGKP